MRPAALLLLCLALQLPLHAQGGPTSLCKPGHAAMGPDLLLSAEVAAGANAARSERLPWRFTGRITPTYMLDRAKGIGVGAMLGGTTSQPAAAILGVRASARLMSLLKLTSFDVPGAEIQGGAEYGYYLGGDHAHSVAGTIGLELVGVGTVTVRGNRIFAYDSDVGRVPAQWVFEMGLGRTFALHTPKAPPLKLPTVASNLQDAFNLGQAEAQAATQIPATPATATDSARAARCDDVAIARFTAFSTKDAAGIQTRTQLIAALRARGLTKQADEIDLLFPTSSTASESELVRAIIRGIQFVFPP
jgi:hypothetical protein